MPPHNQPDLFARAYDNEDPRVRLTNERRAAERETATVLGMVRRRDRKTSVAAAHEVKRRSGTIREAVEQFYDRRGPMGATDSEVKAHYDPDNRKPESSYRKRRTELAQDGVILDTGRERGNRFGVMEKVWVHRDHAAPDAKRVEPVETRKSQREAIMVRALQIARNYLDGDGGTKVGTLEIIDAALNGTGQ